MKDLGASEGAGVLMKFRTIRLLVGLVFVAFLVIGPALLVSADDGVVLAQEETPYAPPEVESVDVPSWLAPLEPLARLPLWGQAAVLSAGVAGMFFVLPLVFRWVWNLGEDATERENGSRS